jgi:hypothetical protein
VENISTLVEHGYTVRESPPRKKQQKAAFLPLAFQTRITMGPMNSKWCFNCYQTIVSRGLLQKQKQTLTKKVGPSDNKNYSFNLKITQNSHFFFFFSLTVKV